MGYLNVLISTLQLGGNDTSPFLYLLLISKELKSQ